MSHKQRAQTSWNLSYNQNGTQSLQPTLNTQAEERSSYAHPPISPRAQAQPLTMTSALHNTVPTVFAKDLLTQQCVPNSEHFSAFTLAGIETMLQTMEYDRRQARRGRKSTRVGKHTHYASSPFEKEMLLAATKQQSLQYVDSPHGHRYMTSGVGSSFGSSRAGTLIEATKLLLNQQQAHRARTESGVHSGTNVFEMIANAPSQSALSGQSLGTNNNSRGDHVYTFSNEVLTDSDLQMAMNAANGTSTRNIPSLDVSSSRASGRFFDGNEWESAIKELESHGQWIECRTTLTGRVMWYNTNSFRLVFDRPPELEAYMEEIEKNKEKFVANKQNAAIHDNDVNDRSLHWYTKKKIEPKFDEDIVETLLYFSENKWNFNNDMVQVYRAQAARKNHHKMLPPPQQYCFPGTLIFLSFIFLFWHATD